MKEGKTIHNAQLTMHNCKEGYKKTELGWIPEEWEVRKLKELGESIIGLTYSPDDLVDEDGVLVLRSSNIKENRLVFNNNKYVNKKIPEKLITKENDILICSRNGSKDLIGKCALIDKSAVGNSFGAFMTIYRGQHNKFLFQVFNSYMLKRQIYNNLGATINQITTDNLNNFKVPFPSLKEQQKIAEILSTVDSQIDDTDKLIEKTKELKKGLMQRLLTKGIGHTEFKKTEIGEIPVEWEVKNLLNLSLTKGEYGIGASATEYVQGKPRYLRITDIGEDSRLLNNEIRGFEESEYENFILKQGDIVFARTGNTTGKSYVYNVNDGELVYAGFLIRFRINKESANENYIKYVLQTKRYWDWVKVMSTRSGQPGINSNEYGELKIQLPFLDEQNKIANIISSVDTQIEEYKNKKAKLEQLKKALMQQLLTGKIRVKV
ncbi:restriction endonuclease subunit S [Haloimpatiens lingqiaonensis]|uniref:restriction endonuclease subunit S n=1 Tax=Haloimpatiens lingqiaonensis TaxID=1380675 RepID=UPI0010FDEA1D|nr:restriction endonuclease subunit S [Haloimpatiens lingqiaonensis]